MDYFGHAVSISGDTAMVGPIGDDDQGSDSGSAYVAFAQDLEDDVYLVKDIYPGLGDPWTGPGELTAVDGALFFSANDGAHGGELWKSDGTEAGTVLVADINSGSDSSGPGELSAVDGALFFAADDGAHGRELWAMRRPIYLPIILKNF
jgi:ELWxxDGT repeat protein